MIPIQGSALERSWKAFFSGSYLFEDVHPSIQGCDRIGKEEGVDLFLAPQWRRFLPSGMIQIKASPAEALRFLEEGLDRSAIIPVVFGPVPRQTEPHEVLRRLQQDYCWYPQYTQKSPFTFQLEEFLGNLVRYPEASLFRQHRPRWALGVS